MTRLKDVDRPPVHAVVIAWFMRDASFWGRPDTTKPKRVHLRHPTKQSRYEHARAMCGNVALMDEQDGGEFVNPPESMKCKRCLRCLEASR